MHLYLAETIIVNINTLTIVTKSELMGINLFLKYFQI